jgi:hypothetical protein
MKSGHGSNRWPPDGKPSDERGSGAVPDEHDDAVGVFD